ncbi:MAG TPA: hypothetical protein VIX19_04290 [Terriglobales bacterium]
MKKLTLKQLEARKEETERIAQQARDQADRADYALQRAALENSKGVCAMPVQTRRELIDRIKELEGENEDLQSRLDEIADLVTPEEEEEDDEEEDRRRD